ncbi:MAG: hypothetical protein ACXWUP_11135, partial [Allosphingosinicella sp.]
MAARMAARGLAGRGSDGLRRRRRPRLAVVAALALSGCFGGAAVPEQLLTLTATESLPAPSP